MRLILVRHGETTWNAEQRLQGQDNAPLSPRGIEQAKLFAAFARALLPDRVISSDLGRTRQTVSLLGFAGAPMDPRLREIDMGDLTGSTKPELEAEMPDDYLAWRAGTFTPKSAESWSAFRQRVAVGPRDCLLSAKETHLLWFMVA